MDWSNVDFCDGDERVCPSDIVDLLVGDGKVFPESLRDTFEKRYAKMQNNFQIKMLRGCGNRVAIIPENESLWDQGDFKIVAPIVEERDEHGEVKKRKAVYKDALLEISQEKLKFEGDKSGADFWIGNDNDGILNYPCVGHDLPIWMKRKNGGNGKRIMIVSQDPLRSRHGKGKLLISSPFGFHSADYRSESKMMKLVNWLVVQKDAVVYLTDFMKVYNRGDGKIGVCKDGVVKRRGISKWVTAECKCECRSCSNDGCCGKNWSELENGKKRFQDKFRCRYENALEAEINKFDPCLILTFGESATESLQSMSSECANDLKDGFTDKVNSGPDYRGDWRKSRKDRSGSIYVLAFLHPTAHGGNSDEYCEFVQKKISEYLNRN